MNEKVMREHLKSVIMERVTEDQNRRKEALFEYFAVAMPGISEDQALTLSEMVPPVLPKLYEKWAVMCVDRMVETIPQVQLEHLCNGQADNNAAIILVYLMFLESERMEKQIPEDMAEYGLNLTGNEDGGDVAADYIRARMKMIRDEMKQ